MILDLQSAWRELTKRFREIRYFSSTSWPVIGGVLGFPELSDYSQLSDYNWTEWSMKNKTAYAPMISEFGKATRSKSFHVRYTWFNDQTIMRKFHCYSLFNLCLENSFSQSVLFFNFIFYLVFYYVWFSICQLHVLILVFTHETGELGPFTFMLLDRGYFWIVCYWLVRHLYKGKVCPIEKYQSS